MIQCCLRCYYSSKDINDSGTCLHREGVQPHWVIDCRNRTPIYIEEAFNEGTGI